MTSQVVRSQLVVQNGKEVERDCLYFGKVHKPKMTARFVDSGRRKLDVRLTSGQVKKGGALLIGGESGEFGLKTRKGDGGIIATSSQTRNSLA